MMMMDEEELLNAPDDQQHVTDEIFDVDELLGPSDLKDNAIDVNDTCGIVSDNAPEETGATDTSLSAARNDESFEREELDYDEDDDEERKEERTGRFTSERKQTNATQSSTTNNIGKVESRRQSENKHQGQKQWQNGGRGNARGRGNGHRNKGGSVHYNRDSRIQSGIPSLMMNQNGPTPLLALNTQALFPPPSGGKILINPNFRGPVGPSGPGLIGGPPSVIPSITGRPSILSSIVPGQTGPIIPRLPNGIPLTGLPSNHGAAGFGPPPHANRPPMPPSIIPGMSPLIGRPAPVGQWDQAVEEFLSGSTLQRQRSPRSRRHRRSSSYSSYTSYSSRSRSAGSSRSRSPRRRRETRGGNGRVRVQRDRGVRGTHFRGRGGPNRRDNPPRRENRDHKQISAECAKAVGLDNDYLSKLEDQRRKRDEVLRRKEQRRFGGSGHDSTSNARLNDRNSNRQNQQRDRRPHDGVTSSAGGGNVSNQSTSRPSTEAEAALKKNKAYLCVNVKNVKQLTTAKMRVETLAKDLGEIRVLWNLFHMI
ncbi:hypothetical protein DICVIV_04916 [Dictyocaulus viviparus]|uniref:Uncharacterized protein n=1 Tax=Dictyocaulus viviparus TaxID=29172 RepID=A0A0D8Y2Z5_DICVI|nr:hypothetical protein DICVIV_04916 [Dictyocaulus viviparus]